MDLNYFLSVSVSLVKIRVKIGHTTALFNIPQFSQYCAAVGRFFFVITHCAAVCFMCPFVN